MALVHFKALSNAQKNPKQQKTSSIQIVKAMNLVNLSERRSKASTTKKAASVYTYTHHIFSRKYKAMCTKVTQNVLQIFYLGMKHFFMFFHWE